MNDYGENLNRVRFKEDCIFCTLGEERLTKKFPNNNEEEIVCYRGFYEGSKHCIVTLAPEQYSLGHTLIILKEHAEDMSDKEVTENEYIDMCNTIREVSILLKNKLRAERIYVCSLCDGVKHLHFHLIPRYKTDIKGFNFVGEREILYNIGIKIGPECSKIEERARWIESIANKLKNTVP